MIFSSRSIHHMLSYYSKIHYTYPCNGTSLIVWTAYRPFTNESANHAYSRTIVLQVGSCPMPQWLTPSMSAGRADDRHTSITHSRFQASYFERRGTRQALQWLLFSKDDNETQAILIRPTYTIKSLCVLFAADRHPDLVRGSTPGNIFVFGS